MKVEPVSFSFSAKKIQDTRDLNSYPFLYTGEFYKKDSQNMAKGFKITTAILALMAVGYTLVSLLGPKKLSNNIVEVADVKKGLNKIQHSKRTIAEIKNKVLYPLMSALKGDKNALKGSDFKSGLILTDSNNEKLLSLTNGFIDHVKELGINAVTIPHTITRINSKGKTCTKTLKRNELNKLILNALKNARNNFNENKQYTVINIGDINKLTDLKVIKSQKSNFEALLENLNSKTCPGVIWAGWTNKTKSLPLFFNDLPILITKLVD